MRTYRQRRNGNTGFAPGESSLRAFFRMVIPFVTYYLLNLAVSLIYLAGTGAYLAMSGAYSAEKWQETVSGLGYAMTLTMAIAAIPLMLFWWKKDRERRAEREGNKEKEKSKEKDQKQYEKINAIEKNKQPVQMLLCAVIGISACFFINHILLLTGLTEAYSEDLESVSEILYQGKVVLELVGTGCIIPIAEELVYRALTMGRIRDYLGAPAAILVSALIFGAMHGNFLQGLFAFLLGLLLGYSYYRCGTLAAPILMHMGANLISVLVSETSLFQNVYQNSSLFLAVTVGSGILLAAGVSGLIRSTGSRKQK